MIFDTGSKSFWLGALFAMLIFDSVLRCVCGVAGAKKSSTYDIFDSITAIIIFVISIGWWFGS